MLRCCATYPPISEVCSLIFCPTIRRYKTRAYRFLNAEKVAKQERREAEKLRVKEEKAAAKAKIEADRAALVEEDEKEQEKVICLIFSSSKTCSFDWTNI